MNKQKVSAFFDKTILILFLLLVIGTPLLFTSYTRSVFEVNKLLILRIITLLTYGLWLLRYILFKDNGYDTSKEKSYSILGFRWQKIGLEWPMVIWIGFNILSTLFSQNVRVSIIGAYDRWEGIITVVNYILLWLMFAKLITKKFQLEWVLGGIIFPAALSACYGIFQSLGMDFMNWSVNPTSRVFACINNPVHFCAYMGMIAPLGLGWLLYLAQSKPGFKQFSMPRVFWKWFLFILICMIYYAQVLSFSRATWMGFIGAMTLFYLVTLRLLDIRSEKKFLIDFGFSSLTLGSFYMLFIFRLFDKSLIVGILLSSIILAYLAYLYKTTKSEEETRSIPLLSFCMSLGLMFFAFIANLGPSLGHWSLAIKIGLSLYFIRICFKARGALRQLLLKVVVILIFGCLQFVALSVTTIFSYSILVIAFYLLQKDTPVLTFEKKMWLTLSVAIYGLVLVTPTIPYHIQKIFNTIKPTHELKAGAFIEGKIGTYKNDAVKGTARTSMWKSSFPWIKDYWLLGSGLDTIKYMYPVYRRPEYGILEGGHNFTPDRLHNEYLNTLATRGIPATLVFYGGLILGWFILCLKAVYKMKEHAYAYLIIGLVAGASIYLGQIFFNFGVVATLVLFYIFTGLSHAIAANSDFQVETDVPKE